MKSGKGDCRGEDMGRYVEEEGVVEVEREYEWKWDRIKCEREECFL